MLRFKDFLGKKGSLALLKSFPRLGTLVFNQEQYATVCSKNTRIFFENHHSMSEDSFPSTKYACTALPHLFFIFFEYELSFFLGNELVI